MYRIILEKRVVAEDIPLLPKSARSLIQKAIDTRLVSAPQHYGKPLRHSLSGHRRLGVADYRIIYRIDERDKIVYIVAIGLCRDIYEH